MTKIIDEDDDFENDFESDFEGPSMEEYEDDDLIVLEKNNPVFDVKHYIYESIFINLPLKLVHPTINGVSGCNPETLKKLEELKQNKENESDPRWDALKKLNK